MNELCATALDTDVVPPSNSYLCVDCHSNVVWDVEFFNVDYLFHVLLIHKTSGKRREKKKKKKKKKKKNNNNNKKACVYMLVHMRDFFVLVWILADLHGGV